MSISKSEQKQMGCQHFYAHTHFSNEPVLQRIGSSPLAETGTEFHDYRALYVQHLIKAERRKDPEWAKRWLEQATLSDDAREMIELDIETFEVDHEHIFGTELFLSVDRNFLPARKIQNSQPGSIEPLDSEFAHGTLDLVHLEGSKIAITDYKTGYSNKNVSDYEAAHYSVLAFAHFPYVKSIEFDWEFTRAKARKPHAYTREDLEWMQPMVRAVHERKIRIKARFEAGEELDVNPTAGMCGYCPLECPLRTQVTTTKIDLVPIQTEQDARLLAQRIVVADIYSENGRELLKSWLDTHGRLDVGGGYVAEMVASTSNEYSLPAALEALGLAVPDKSPKWGVTLSSLKVGASGLHSFAKAKFRSGMREELDRIATTKPRFTLKIYRPETENDLVPEQQELISA